MNQAAKQLIRKLGTKRVSVGEPLAPHTYMKVGGPADLFYVARSSEDLAKAVQAASEAKVPYFILGGGSNILVGDKGVRGLVIKNRADAILIQKVTGTVKGKKMAVEEAMVVAESGVITNLLVRRTIDEGLSGLEYFLGVPGTLGGAIYNNSHFQTELIGNLVETVTVLGGGGRQKAYTRDEMRFGYDSSILQETREPVIRVTFLLKGGDPKKLWKRAEEFARYRSQSQPLAFPSSGCIFKNVKANGTYGHERKGLTSAGYLIEKAGMKGKRVGAAMVSDKHASFIVNTGGATAREVNLLIEKVRTAVREKFGVILEMEVFKVGEFT